MNDAILWMRHLLFPGLRLRWMLDMPALAAIEQAIIATEAVHGGEIQVVVEGGLGLPALLRGQDARARALQVFSDLRVWDTQHNSGVLIYVLWAEREVQIVADRGYNDRISSQQWAELCQQMQLLFGSSVVAALVAGVQVAGALIAEVFPAADANELPDRPVVM